MCTPVQCMEAPPSHAFSCGPCFLGRLQLFLGFLYPWPFWEVGDSCYHKARDSWVAGDSWMGLAYPCIQTAQAPPGHTPGSWLLRPQPVCLSVLFGVGFQSSDLEEGAQAHPTLNLSHPGKRTSPIS